MARYDGLGDAPPKFNIADNDRNYESLGAHTLEHHGPQLPLTRGAPNVRTLEGRLYGDAPWPKPENWSYRWLDVPTMNRAINEYVSSHWEQIRSVLAMDGRFKTTFDAGRVVGEGYFNRGMYGTGPTAATYAKTAFVELRMRLVPGTDPPQVFVVTAFPSGQL
jgi:hypothetical protein